MFLMDSSKKVDTDILFLSLTKYAISICFESIRHLMQITRFIQHVKVQIYWFKILLPKYESYSEGMFQMLFRSIPRSLGRNFSNKHPQ